MHFAHDRCDAVLADPHKNISLMTVVLLCLLTHTCTSRSTRCDAGLRSDASAHPQLLEGAGSAGVPPRKLLNQGAAAQEHNHGIYHQ